MSPEILTKFKEEKDLAINLMEDQVLALAVVENELKKKEIGINSVKIYFII